MKSPSAIVSHQATSFTLCRLTSATFLASVRTPSYPSAAPGYQGALLAGCLHGRHSCGLPGAASHPELTASKIFKASQSHFPWLKAVESFEWKAIGDRMNISEMGKVRFSQNEVFLKHVRCRSFPAQQGASSHRQQMCNPCRYFGSSARINSSRSVSH